MAKPKVMRIISDLPVGGVENRLLAVLPSLKHKYDIQICCIRARGILADEFEKAGIPVVVKYFRSRLHPVSLYRLAAYMREQRVDLVHTHMYRPNISGVIAAKLAKVPVIISQVHSVDHWDNRRQVFMDSLLVSWRDRVIAVSEAVKQDYIKRTGMDPQKCVVIYNGIDTDNFNRSGQAERIKQKWGINPDDKVVGIIARIVPAKDHMTFIQAAKQIHGNIPQVKFLIVGEEEGKCGILAQLEARVAEWGLTNEVIFTGPQKDIADLLSVMDVSVLSSIREGFSNVALESMAAGVPMVATDVGGNAEAIKHGTTGFLVPAASPSALAEAIIKIITSPALAESMRRAARKRAQLFSLQNNIQQIDQLYSDMLDRKC
jgi:glycosyltransferase involved in cell wall biosynthesis